MYRWNPEDYARHSAGQEAWARELLSGLNLRPYDRVLDIGCGDGRITAELAQRVPFGRVVGVDLSEDMIGYAASRFPAAEYPNLEFRLAEPGRCLSTRNSPWCIPMPLCTGSGIMSRYWPASPVR